MQSSKFIKQLKLLNKTKTKAFLHFVQSPYHNSVKILVPLLEEILQYAPDFKHENLERNTLLRFIYPKSKKDNKGRINVLFTQLLKLLEEFRTIETFKADKLLYQQMKMQSYEAIRLDKSFFKAAEEYESLLEQMPKDEKQALASFLHFERLYEHPGINKYDRNSQAFQQSLLLLNRSLLWYSMIYILQAKNRNRVLNVENNVANLISFLGAYDEKIKNNPSLSFYKALIDLQDNEDRFQETVFLFQKSYSKFPLSLQKDGITILLNIGMKKLRDGAENLKLSLAELYKIGLKQDLFLNKEKRLRGTTFINIVTITTACGDFKWARIFIQEKNGIIINKEKEDAINLSWAYFFYHKAVSSKEEQNFAQVINYLNSIQLMGVFFFYRTRLLELRTYYEYYLIQKRDALFILNKVTAFEQMLKRKKQLGSKFTPFNEFAKSFRKLVEFKIQEEIKAQEIASFQGEILSKEKLFSRGWLLQKAGELG